MIALEVTHHAVERYQQRVEAVEPAQASAALTAPAIQQAADFGARFVRLGTGQHVVIEQHRVITVLPKDTTRRHLMLDGIEHKAFPQVPHG